MRQSFGVVVGIAIAAAGCASGAFNSERPASQLYTISAAPPGTPATTVLPVDLAVARPLPRPGLDTERIAVRYADRRVDYYAVARWGAEAADVVQDLLIDSLRASGGLRTVHGHLSAFASQYVAHSSLYCNHFRPASASIDSSAWSAFSAVASLIRSLMSPEPRTFSGGTSTGCAARPESLSTLLNRSGVAETPTISGTGESPSVGSPRTNFCTVVSRAVSFFVCWALALSASRIPLCASSMMK